MPPSPLISATALQALMNSSPAPVILDLSFDLANPSAGEDSFVASHIAGARHVHLERDLSGPKHFSTGAFAGRHPLRPRSDYAQLMGHWGIVPGTPVVVYDRQLAMFAARLWWTLRWMGHAQVWVLDGGLAAWERAGGRLSQGAAAPLPSRPAYPTRAPDRPTLTAAALLAQLPQRSVIDARAPERFRGEVEPLDAVAGHIPSARNRCYKDNLQGDGTFKPTDQLRAEFTALLDGAVAAQVVHQCGSGVTACHNLLAMEHAGLDSGALYPGSWSEWSALGEAYPKEKGVAN